MANTVETKEALIALIRLGKFIASQAKDGFQVGDGLALAQLLITSEAFRDVIVDGFLGAAQIPAELKEISFEDGMELAMTMISELKR